jgi:hypothetical protein
MVAVGGAGASDIYAGWRFFIANCSIVDDVQKQGSEKKWIRAKLWNGLNREQKNQAHGLG